MPVLVYGAETDTINRNLEAKRETLRFHFTTQFTSAVVHLYARRSTQFQRYSKQRIFGCMNTSRFVTANKTLPKPCVLHIKAYSLRPTRLPRHTWTQAVESNMHTMNFCFTRSREMGRIESIETPWQLVETATLHRGTHH